MRIIAKECFSREWVLGLKVKYPLANPVLVEKVIYAFELLGLLVRGNKPFIFRGGTSLMLLLPQPKRLSIDIDVIGHFTLDDLKQAITDSTFTGVEEDVRVETSIPKSHFKISYRSTLNRHPEYVLLDSLNVPSPYPETLTKEIESEFFKVQQVVSSAVPSIDSMLGEKLTAFAPETIGVPFGKEKSMEIIKQLFDIGELFTACSGLEEVRDSYHRTFELENGFRGSKYITEEALDDTIRTAYLICHLDMKSSAENEKTGELRKGIRQIASYLLQTRFGLLNARVAAARAAYVACLI